MVMCTGPSVRLFLTTGLLEKCFWCLSLRPSTGHQQAACPFYSTMEELCENSLKPPLAVNCFHSITCLPKQPQVLRKTTVSRLPGERQSSRAAGLSGERLPLHSAFPPVPAPQEPPLAGEPAQQGGPSFVTPFLR